MKYFTSNADGGLDPADAQSLARARKVDLITLPPDVPGTNCANCRYAAPRQTQVAEFWCVHPAVNLPITPRMCCALWDNQGVHRPWLKT